MKGTQKQKRTKQLKRLFSRLIKDKEVLMETSRQTDKLAQKIIEEGTMTEFELKLLWERALGGEDGS